MGELRNKNFCVVVSSQMDDIDRDVFCKGSREAKADDVLQVDIASIKSLTEQSAKNEAKIRAEEKELEKLTLQKQKVKRDLAALKPQKGQTRKI